MTAAPEIPADVMAAAGEVRDEWFRNPSRITFETAIARAILAERQRAADYVSRRPGSIPHMQEIVSGLLRGDVCDVSGKITRGNDT